MPSYVLDREGKIFTFSDSDIYCLAAFLSWIKEQKNTDEKFKKVLESANHIYLALNMFRENRENAALELKEVRKILRYFHPDKIDSSPFGFFASFTDDQAFDEGVRDIVKKEAATNKKSAAEIVSSKTTSAINKILAVPESEAEFKERLRQRAVEEESLREAGATKLDKAISKVLGSSTYDQAAADRSAQAGYSQSNRAYGLMIGELMPFLGMLLNISIEPVNVVRAKEHIKKRTSSEDAQGGTKAKEEGGGFFGFGFGGKKATAKTDKAEAAEPAKAAAPNEDFNTAELARKQKYKREEVAPFFDGIILVVDALHKAWLENDPQAFRDLQTNQTVSKMRDIFKEVKKQAQEDAREREFNFVGYEWLEAALNGLDKNQVPSKLKIAPGKSFEKHLDLFKELVADYFMLQKYQDKNALIVQMIVPFTNLPKVKELNAVMRGAVKLDSAAAEKASKAAQTASSNEAFKPVPPAKPETKQTVPPPIPKRYVPQPKSAQTATPKKEFTPTATSAAEAKKLEFQVKADAMRKAREEREARARERDNKNKPGSSKT